MKVKLIILFIVLIIAPYLLISQKNKNFIEDFFINDTLSTFIYIKDDTIAFKLFSFGGFGEYYLFYGSYNINNNNEFVFSKNLIFDIATNIKSEKNIEGTNLIKIIILDNKYNPMDFTKIYFKTISEKEEIKQNLDSQVLSIEKDSSDSFKKDYYLVVEKGDSSVVKMMKLDFGNTYEIKKLILLKYYELLPYNETCKVEYNLQFDRIVVCPYINYYKGFKKKLSKKKYKKLLIYYEDEQTLYRRKSNYNSVSEFMEKNLFNNAGFD
ncbi:MAG: hypothetical protein LBV69_11110 [Bacteroidales bacterium]|jgi:hypothetical protein|nr:hypothetical protein [Bacteroidales bacterium]